MNCETHNADCLDAMRQMADNSVDAIVTDPPYGINFMNSQWDCPSGMLGQMAQGKEKRGMFAYGGSHNRGYKDCDNAKFQEYMTPIFAEALRVAKPGAHLLAFGGSRTYHRMACAIEDAGWEIRDCIMWVYGSGFPKSMDVSKAIDKRLGFKGEVVGTRMVDVGMQGGNMHAGREHKMEEQEIRAHSPEAAKWNGYGTCLKPSYEPVIVARKPLDGTVADNVLKWGTGALNIDGCRIPLAADDELQNGVRHDGKPIDTQKAGWGFRSVDRTPGLGRFPANLVHDGSDEVLACFPDSKGQCGAVKGDEPSELTHEIYGKFSGNRPQCTPRGDSGSAARFFYCAKASRSERGEGNGHPTVKPLALMRWLITLVAPPNAVVLDPFMGSGTTGVAALQLGRRFIGVEREAEYYEIAKCRLDDATLPLFNQQKGN